MSHAELHFHCQGRDLDEIKVVATGVADRFFNYKATIDNKEAYEAWTVSRSEACEKYEAESNDLTELPEEQAQEWHDRQMVGWDDENPAPPKELDNPEKRPYKLTIEARADTFVDRYSYNAIIGFRCDVRAYLPRDYD